MKALTEADAASFRDFIDRHDFFYICGHKEPDGDCVCSCIALGMLVQKKGKEFQLLSAGPFKRTEIKRYENRFSSSMRFLSEEERKKSALIITDCSEYARLGDIDGDLRNLDTCVIDHHKTASAPEGALCIIDSSSPAACAIVQLLYESLVGCIPKDAAEILSKPPPASSKREQIRERPTTLLPAESLTKRGNCSAPLFRVRNATLTENSSSRAKRRTIRKNGVPKAAIRMRCIRCFSLRKKRLQSFS